MKVDSNNSIILAYVYINLRVYIGVIFGVLIVCFLLSCLFILVKSLHYVFTIF